MSNKVTFDYSKAGSFISEEEDRIYEKADTGRQGDTGI